MLTLGIMLCFSLPSEPFLIRVSLAVYGRLCHRLIR